MTSQKAGSDHISDVYAPELSGCCDGGRNTDGVVEGEAKGLVHFLTALASIEEVLLDVVQNVEPNTALIEDIKDDIIMYQREHLPQHERWSFRLHM